MLPKISLVGCRLKDIEHTARHKPCYEKISVNEFCPVEPRKKYLFIQDLKKGLTVPTILYTCSTQSRLGNYHFLWRIPDSVTLEASTPENVRIISDIKASLPTYHSHALRREFVNKYGTVAGIKSHVLHQIYRELTGKYGVSLLSCT